MASFFSSIVNVADHDNLFAQRSEKLISTIKKYEQDKSGPPESLNDLVPSYLASIPTTGMMAYPQYQNHSGPEAHEKYVDNPWVLSVYGVDHNMGRKPWASAASALRLICRNALASGLARLMIDASVYTPSGGINFDMMLYFPNQNYPARGFQGDAHAHETTSSN